MTSVAPGAALSYSIVVTNNGPNAVSGAPVTDTFPSALTVGTWTCAATAGSSCAATGTGNARTGSVTLLNGGGAIFTAGATLSATASGSLANTASVAAPAGTIDPNTANNSATDTDTIVVAVPPLNLLDTFNRANATTLGGNWSQVVLGGAAGIRVNTSQAFCPATGIACLIPGQAIWNGTTFGGPTFGNRQGAAFTFASAPVNGTALYLKASGGSAALPLSFIRVLYNPSGTGNVVVATTTTGGLTFTLRFTFPASFAAGDTLTAVALQTGQISVYKTSGAVVTLVGTGTIPGPGFWTGTGRIGIRLPAGARVDNFSGGNVP